MSETLLVLPVSVEQIAAVIRQMTRDDRQRLISLVPDLRQTAQHPPSRTPDQALTSVEHLRKKVMAALNNQPLQPDEPFLGNLTLSQYNALPDDEKSGLWDKWEAETDLAEFEEKEVDSGALSA
ncbi:MAG: hypothetical protein GY795_51710 [Desulfobacterales bacterium]|nr:hypothetical protein [Desulfobacterales bacterium]